MPIDSDTILHALNRWTLVFEKQMRAFKILHSIFRGGAFSNILKDYLTVVQYLPQFETTHANSLSSRPLKQIRGTAKQEGHAGSVTSVHNRDDPRITPAPYASLASATSAPPSQNHSAPVVEEKSEGQFEASSNSLTHISLLSGPDELTAGDLKIRRPGVQGEENGASFSRISVSRSMVVSKRRTPAQTGGIQVQLRRSELQSENASGPTANRQTQNMHNIIDAAEAKRAPAEYPAASFSGSRDHSPDQRHFVEININATEKPIFKSNKTDSKEASASLDMRSNQRRISETNLDGNSNSKTHRVLVQKDFVLPKAVRQSPISAALKSLPNSVQPDQADTAPSAHQNAVAALKKRRQIMDGLRHHVFDGLMPNMHLHPSAGAGFYRMGSEAGIHEGGNQRPLQDSAQPMAWRRSKTQQKSGVVQTIHNTFYVNMGVDTTATPEIHPSDLKDKLYRLLTDEAEKLGIDT